MKMGICCTCQEAHPVDRRNGETVMVKHSPSFMATICKGSGDCPQAVFDTEGGRKSQQAHEQFIEEMEGA
jgi:hypothetical protein